MPSITINGNTTIGSTTKPVILIVNANLKLAGTATINGYLFVNTAWDNSGGGNATINGGVVVNGPFSATGTPDINYNTNLLDSLNTANVGEFAKVPGSWKDL